MADRFQDTMGFTVTGPNRFLGSGHPDFQDKEMLREGKDPHLGLIESTDAGQTWKALSLLGEADFHALAAAHGQIYGYSATDGEFMVSPDGKTWDRRSKIDLVSFAVDPENPEHVVATTQGGLVTSSDGGRAWQALSGPALAWLSWDRGGGLWGAGPDGSIHRSADQGSTWAPQGKLSGAPEALLVDGEVLYAAVSEQGIFAPKTAHEPGSFAIATPQLSEGTFRRPAPRAYVTVVRVPPPHCCAQVTVAAIFMPAA